MKPCLLFTSTISSRSFEAVLDQVGVGTSLRKSLRVCKNTMPVIAPRQVLELHLSRSNHQK